MQIRIIAAVLLSMLAFVLWAATATPITPTTTATPTIPAANATSEYATVVRVIDGDTIDLDTGERVRYIGIDTPEVHPTKDCYGTQAAKRNRELVQGMRVRLEKDVSNTDKYGRLLRYVYLDEPTSSIHSQTSINEILVAEGFAYAVSFPPDVSKQHILRTAQQKAREANRGLWSSCNE